ncbi:hypothetical protein HHK36_030862 [Tetracentron sinense]|uniref:TF-B3 domain-containing protein n=1 Tax=Tetracentron sinense TaxID=13715 RepID=A0A835CYP2_TETSI|nr:hypothetical protein HHK36_030862 [Tetracentron sinense]
MINGEKWEKAVLKSGRGSWDVKVSRNSEGRLHLKEGWTAFVKHHKLSVGDFIVFEHKGDMVFHVLLFDKSGYENDYPLPVDAALNNDKGSGLQGQGNTHNHAKRFKGQSPVEVATSGSSAPHCPHFKTTIKACNIPPTTPYLIEVIIVLRVMDWSINTEGLILHLLRLNSCVLLLCRKFFSPTVCCSALLSSLAVLLAS